MNICFVVYDFSEIGGINTVCTQLANSFADENNIYILNLNPKKVSLSNKYNLNSKIRIETINLVNGRLLHQAIRAQGKIRKFLNRVHIDVSLLMGNYAGLFGTLAHNKKNKMIFCDHGALENQWEDKKIRIIRLVSSKLNDCVVVLTDRSRWDYIRRFKIPESKVKTIYNFAKIAALMNDYNVTTKKIVSIGRMTEEKGFDLLIQIAEKVLPLNLEWQWDVYGDGPLLEEYKKRVETLGLENQLHFCGNQSDAGNLIRNYALYVLPSYREGLPLVLLEAKFSMVPSISFDIQTGPNEIIRDGVNGYLVQPYDVDAMADKIQYLIDHDDVRSQFSKDQKIDSEKFNEKNILEKWKYLILSVSKGENP